MTAELQTKQMPENLLFVVGETLSDGSKVYNVHFGNIKLPGVDYDEAVQLAEGIVDLINDHTTQNADLIIED